MRPLRAGAIVTAFAALVAAGVLIAALGASATPQTRTTEIYTDKTGDGMPDITTVTVSHDANGTVTLALTVVGIAAPVAQDTRRDLSVFAEPDDDTSPNAAAPYNLIYQESATATGCMLLKNDGTSYRQAPSTARCAKSGDTVTWTFQRDDIGAKAMFSFFAVSGLVSNAGQVLGVDRAPEFGRWGYDFTAATTTGTTTAPAPAFAPVIGKPAVTPARPVAGKPFTVTFAVTRSDNRAPLAVGTMTCDPTIAGRLVPHSEQFKAGRARISIRVPANGKGKTLKLRLAITSKGQSATRTAAFQVAVR